MSNDLRIYWGNGRVIIPGDDPKVGKILAIVHDELRPGEYQCDPNDMTFVKMPTTDEEFVQFTAEYIKRRKR